MSQIHDNFHKVIEEIGFKRSRQDGLNFICTGAYGWIYVLKFEGYAYVIYQKMKLYHTPLILLLMIRNKFYKRGHIETHYEVPLTHFREPEKLKIFWEILNQKFEDDI
jgi:hypothetical protein